LLLHRAHTRPWGGKETPSPTSCPGLTGRERRGKATGCCRHVGHWSAAVASRRPFHAVTFATEGERASEFGEIEISRVRKGVAATTPDMEEVDAGRVPPVSLSIGDHLARRPGKNRSWPDRFWQEDGSMLDQIHTCTVRF